MRKILPRKTTEKALLSSKLYILKQSKKSISTSILEKPDNKNTEFAQRTSQNAAWQENCNRTLILTVKQFIIKYNELHFREAKLMKTIPSVKTMSFYVLTVFIMLALLILPVSAEESDELPDNGIPVV